MRELVELLSALLRERGQMMVTAESCTGGMIATAMTDRPGSSAVFERGFVTYSNDSKIELLNVPAGTIEKYGAVSMQTAEAMAAGALANSRAVLALSVTGIAGPGGGTADKPVGLVFIGCGAKDKIHAKEYHFKGTRAEIRKQALQAALKQAIAFLMGKD